MRSTLSLASAASLIGLARAANHLVVLGPNLQYHPSSITAAKGDTISFQIGQNHNVVQSAESSPCSYMSGGVYSGAPYDGSGSVNPDYFVVTVNSTDPLYFFCSEEGHCQAGMVFAVNPPSGKLDSYRSAAEQTSESKGGSAVEGGVYSRDQGGSGSSSGGSSSSSASAAASSSASASRSAAASSSRAASSSASSVASSSAAATSSASSTTSTSGTSGTSAAAASATSGNAGVAAVEGAQGSAALVMVALAGFFSLFL